MSTFTLHTLRHVGVWRALYNSWWHSKKMSLTGTSTILEFPGWRMEFGRVLQHQSGHLEVTVRSSAPRDIPFQEAPSFQSAMGFEVHSFSGVSPADCWKPSNAKPEPEPWGSSPQKWSQNQFCLSLNIEGHIALGSSLPLWTPLTVSEIVTQEQWPQNLCVTANKLCIARDSGEGFKNYELL